jgi:hypothetical protein
VIACSATYRATAGRNRVSRSVYARGDAPRRRLRHPKETMKPFRWFLIALVAGCAGLLAAPLTASAASQAAGAPRAASTAHAASARTTAVAAHTATTPRHHHRHFTRHATPRLSRLSRVASASRTGHRLPANPANRSKTHHANLPSSRGRGHSSYAILPHAPNATPVDRYGALRVGAMDDPGARLDRMLESRGPPRAGPNWISAFRGSYLPPLRTSPAPNISHLDIAQSAPRAAYPCPAASPRLTSSTWSAPWDLVLPSVFEGAAAGHDMPSSGGVTS